MSWDDMDENHKNIFRYLNEPKYHKTYLKVIQKDRNDIIKQKSQDLDITKTVR